MEIKIGANPLCWMNTDFPHLGEGISVEQCLSDISMIGYEGVELEDPFKKVLGTLPEMLNSKNLSCIGKWHSTNILDNGIKKEMERLKDHVDMLESLKSDVVILAECSGAVHQNKGMSLTQRPRLEFEDNWKKLCEGMEKMAQYIKERGFYSAYHHHMGTVVQSGEDILRLLAGTETLGLLFDTGHLAYAGENPLDLLKETLPRITHVHCKAVRPEVLKKKVQEKSSFFSAVIDGVFTVPGDREGHHAREGINFEKIIETLIRGKYKGWIVMEAEQDPNKADPFHYAQMGYETLHSLLNPHFSNS